MTWSVGAGLEGKGVIVTGAAGGIGKAVAQAFSATGAKVMAVDLDLARTQEVVDGFEGSGPRRRGRRPGRPGAATLRSSRAHATSSATCTRWPTWPRCCVAGAASTRSPRTTGTSSTTSTSRPPSSCARAAGNAMIEQGQGGRIITFSSQGWWTGGFGGSVAYAATKGGVTSMTRGLARTFGPHRITVNLRRAGPGPHADAHDRPRRPRSTSR